MSAEYLMGIVAFVFQDVFLFKQSMADNIAVGRRGASREQVVAAAKAAQCHEFIERLPRGYDTVFGSEGVRLSGGECQRVVIARAILKDAPILALDEATAFADPENESKIQGALSRLMKNKTVIIIAHRLSTVRGADKIVVMDRGAKVEEGDHSSLVGAGGRYSAMWEHYTRALDWTLGGKTEKSGRSRRGDGAGDGESEGNGAGGAGEGEGECKGEMRERGGGDGGNRSGKRGDSDGGAGGANNGRIEIIETREARD
jgi:ATP-binding cassette subfamily B protein